MNGSERSVCIGGARGRRTIVAFAVRQTPTRVPAQPAFLSQVGAETGTRRLHGRVAPFYSKSRVRDPLSLKVRSRAGMLTGLTRWSLKPASRTRRRSSICP